MTECTRIFVATSTISLVALLVLLLLTANIFEYKLVIVPVVEVNDGSVAAPDELINQDEAELVVFIKPNVELLL